MGQTFINDTESTMRRLTKKNKYTSATYKEFIETHFFLESAEDALKKIKTNTVLHYLKSSDIDGMDIEEKREKIERGEITAVSTTFSEHRCLWLSLIGNFLRTRPLVSFSIEALQPWQISIVTASCFWRLTLLGLGLCTPLDFQQICQSFVTG